MPLKGLYTALITPFDEQGQLDEKCLRSLLRYQMKHQVNGVVLLGTTGEAPTLTLSEKERIVQIGVEEVKGKGTLIIGTGSYSTQQTIENTVWAKNMGADVALVITPYYNKPTQEGLYQHFKALCDAVEIPICIYTHQGRTGQNLLPETLKRIAAFPNVIAIKEASGNLAQIDDVIQSLNDRPFSILSGEDSLTLPIMALGGHGIISVVSNLIPLPIKQLVKACQKGDLQTARQLHVQLTPFFKAAFLETNPTPIKAAMQLCGMTTSTCRLPLCHLLPENLTKLQAAVKQLPKEWLHHG
jgi:4-hydroxy-tetrahydrodipicolinate synthase